VFARDIALVLDNDRDSYYRIRNEARSLKTAYELGCYIRDYVQTMIETNIDDQGDVGALLIRQLCHGWSIDCYMDYARDILETLESERA
jgi:hypothetical protein